MTPVVEVEEGLAITRGPTVVGTKNCIAVIDQVLNHGAVALRGLTTRASVHQHQRRNGIGRARLLRPVKN